MVIKIVLYRLDKNPVFLLEFVFSNWINFKSFK